MPYSNNYFRVGKHVITFNDKVPESVESAYSTAQLLGEPVLFRPVPTAGPWDRLELVGLRNRTKILADLKIESDEEEREKLHDELTAITIAWADVGRSVPLMAVAA